MSFVLMLVGILATALGAVLIGFGIPINEFSLGNTLILAGTVTAVGGLIIFALSRAVSQLARIADALGNRPLASVAASAAAPFEAPQPELGRPATPRMPAQSRARPEAPAAPRAPEPRLPSDEFDVPVEAEPARPPVAAPRVAALAPEERPAAAPEAPAASGWRPPRPFGAQRKAVPEPRRPAAPQPSADNQFTARHEPAAEAGSAKPEPVSVLKSGVVDGMAYTLYTDGSIEAELAQGVVRFGSIEELRNHLEKSA